MLCFDKHRSAKAWFSKTEISEPWSSRFIPCGVIQRVRIDLKKLLDNGQLGSYRLVDVAGNASQAGRAWTQLLMAKKSDPDDLPVLTALAYLAQNRGNSTLAMELY